MIDPSQQQEQTGTINKTPIPDWVCLVIRRLSRRSNITWEQAAKLLILRGALYYQQNGEDDVS